MSFHSLGLSARITETLDQLGFHTPTPIQAQAIPAVLEGRADLIALAQTGTGKTAAFGLPILEMVQPNSPSIQALVLAPTRELCLQIARDLEKFAARMPGISIVSVYGGAPISTQIRELRRGAHIVTATPGRTVDLLNRGVLKLQDLSVLVLDEADEMLNMGFKDDLETILASTPAERRTMLFSATMPPEIKRMSGRYMQNPVTIQAGSPNTAHSQVEHRYAVLRGHDRYEALRRLSDAENDIYAIVFCRTKRDTQELAENLMRDGYPADALHGDMNQRQRDSVMASFREKRVSILVATDVAARGLDVKNLTHVVHHSLPDDPETYVHRSGRTGRAGSTGISLALIDPRDHRKLKFLERGANIGFSPYKVPGGGEIIANKGKGIAERIREGVSLSSAQAIPQALVKSLESLDKDQLVQWLLHREFGAILDKYTDARDLNMEPEHDRGYYRGGQNYHRPNDSWSGRRPSSGGGRPYRNDRGKNQGGYKRYKAS